MIYNYYIYLQFITVYSYRENLFALSVVERTHFQTVVNIPFISHHKKVLIVKVLSFCLINFVMRHSKFLYSSTKLYKKVVKGDTQKKSNKQNIYLNYIVRIVRTYTVSLLPSHSVHFAKGRQRRILTCEKYSFHMRWKELSEIGANSTT